MFRRRQLARFAPLYKGIEVVVVVVVVVMVVVAAVQVKKSGSVAAR